MYIVKNGSEAVDAAGYDNIEFGNQEAEVNAIIEDINKRGGLLGRRIVAVYSALDPTSPASYDAQAQAACTNWTEDHHVIAVVSTTQSNEPLVECLRAKSVPLIAGGVFIWPRASFERNPLLVTPHSPIQEQAVGIYVDQLASRKFFAPTAPSQPTKIGVMMFDDPAQREVVRTALKPALAKYNLTVAATEAVTYPRAGSDTGTPARQMQGAVLRFQTANVTHVLFLDSKGLLALFFMPVAESQTYRPRYGLSTYDDPGFTLQGTVPDAQLRNSLGVGWGVDHDVDAENNPGYSPLARRCLALFERANLDMSNQSARGLALGFCDGLFLLQAAIDRGREVSAEGFRVGLESLGTSFVPAATFATTFGPNRHAGVAAYRRFAFFDECNCFRYTSGTLSIPPAAHPR